MHEVVLNLMKTMNLSEDDAIHLATRLFPPRTPEQHGGVLMKQMLGPSTDAERLTRQNDESMSRIYDALYQSSANTLPAIPETDDAGPSELEDVMNKYPGLPPHVARAYLAAAQGHAGQAYAPGSPYPVEPNVQLYAPYAPKGGIPETRVYAPYAATDNIRVNARYAKE